MEPAYGAVLTIDGKKISDSAVVIHNGPAATAYVWDPRETQTFMDYETQKPYEVPREPGNEVVAELVRATEEKASSGSRLVGIDKNTGLPSTWLVEPSKKRCQGCHP